MNAITKGAAVPKPESIKDPVDRALVREWISLQAELATVTELLDDKPFLELVNLNCEFQTWMAEHVQESAETIHAQLVRFKTRKQPIEARIRRWKKLDQIKLMDREIDLRLQIETIENFREHRAWSERRKIEDDQVLGAFRAFATISKHRMEHIFRLCRRDQESA